MSKTKKVESKSGDFAFGKENYRMFIIGLAVLITGYLLMIGGGSDDPTVFHYDEIFNPRRITVAPLVILTGFTIIAISIVKKSKQ